MTRLFLTYSYLFPEIAAVLCSLRHGDTEALAIWQMSGLLWASLNSLEWTKKESLLVDYCTIVVPLESNYVSQEDGEHLPGTTCATK